ncbi:hypothetical protein A3842_26195 [Paenibacillus sp. P3E]|uniref:RloB family protein n=1 Tax=Paenibacillus sp. P3E TaxID=1349435 RepID=UPI00093D08BC|nr:RloB family protein [Paenibacillus sp. P3E]OKP69291.1 hypothetical protein A3842_26195 [Paenibacillus sp. P3E]
MGRGKVGKNVRRVGTREPNKRIYILCEGQTEEAYFNNFKSRRVNIDVKVAKAKQTDPISLLAEANRIINDKQLDVKSGVDEIWCIVDLDVAVDNDYVVQLLSRAKKHCTNIVYSNPCFEVWFLLHYERLNTNISIKKLIKKLEKYIPNYKKGECIFTYIGDQTDNAILNAERLEKINAEKIKILQYKECDPHTEVYKLVKKLQSFRI